MKTRFGILIAGDVVLAVLALYTGFVLRFGFYGATEEILTKPFSRSLLFVAVLLLTSYIFELYNLDSHRSRREVFISILAEVSVAMVILSIVFFLAPYLTIGRGLLAISLCSFFLYQILWHILFQGTIGHPFLTERVIVLGTGALAVKMGDLIQSSVASVHHMLTGYVAIEGDNEPVAVTNEKIIGSSGNLIEIAAREKTTKIIASLPGDDIDCAVHHTLLNCKLHGIEVLDPPTFFEQVTGKLLLENMSISWLIFSTGFRRTALISAVKRMIDILLAITGIILSLPLLPFIALLVKLDSPGPLIYRQVRVGYMGKNFVLYKFRTMCEDVERETGAAWAQPNDPRIRPIGSFLRKSRLDELPQLYNVLRGDMSFVGPRPERPEFVHRLEQVIPFYAKRHFIKPGLTGWAQVRFPYGASVEDSYEKLRYDLYYFKNMSPVLDTIIMLQTIKVILFRRGGR